MIDAATEEILSLAVFPHEMWQKIWSNNPLERLNREIRQLGGAVSASSATKEETQEEPEMVEQLVA